MLMFNCFPVPGPNGNGGGFSFAHLLVVWVALAIVLFLVRPSSMRSRGDEKPAPSNDVCCSATRIFLSTLW